MAALIYITLVFIVVLVMLGSYFLGQRHHDRLKGTVYESGMVATGKVDGHFAIRFYLFAVFFVIFDLETVFLLAWASAVRELGWLGFLQASFFIVMLLVALLYLIRVGALNIVPRLRKVGPQKISDLERAL